MKVRILFLFALVLTLSTMATSSVQARQSAREYAEFKETLGLTKEQKKNWDALERSIGIEILRIKKGDLPEETKNRKIRFLRKDESNQLKEILTESQWKKLIAFRRKHRSN